MEQIQTSEECLQLDANNNFELSDRFKTALQNANNPKIALVFGTTRCGKSTLLNNLLKDKNARNFNNRTIKNKRPFKANGGLNRVTVGFQFYGPISSDQFKRRNNIINGNFPEGNYDLFFIDSEGAEDINGQSMNLFKALLMIQGNQQIRNFFKKKTCSFKKNIV